MAQTCRLPECTFSQTGVCLENNPVDGCPNRTATDAVEEARLSADVPPPLQPPPSRPRFPPSLTLGTAEARQLMNGRYCRVIGIVGAPDSGKTASLVSLYLQLARRKLAGFEFADSRSIMAFNEISQGARRWNEGKPPEQMTSHTEPSDDRDAGYLHLRLRRTADRRAVDLLLPDLPGEWSTSFIDSNRADRLHFLKSADAIWVMADGRQLIASESRRGALRRLDLLLQRIAALLPQPPLLLLVISHHDSGAPRPEDLDALARDSGARGLPIEVVSIASFSRADSQIPAGFGIAELIAKSIAPRTRPLAFWPDRDLTQESRAMLRLAANGD